MYQILAYFKFLFTSTNQHGVHSPFIYKFVTECLYDRKNYNAYKAISQYRKDLKKNSSQIIIEDFGSGSRMFQSTKRRISSIAKRSGTPLKRAKLFFRLTQYFKPETILELGTSLGIATHAMAIANSEHELITIEGSKALSEFTTQQLQKFQIHNATLITGQFITEIPKIEQPVFDIIFFDGHHSEKATITYFEQVLPMAQNDSIFIFDDIYWSEGMTKAWHYIKAHPKVTVTVDTFFLGFVFFRKEQVKEHFKIRL